MCIQGWHTTCARGGRGGCRTWMLVNVQQMVCHTASTSNPTSQPPLAYPLLPLGPPTSHLSGPTPVVRCLPLLEAWPMVSTLEDVLPLEALLAPLEVARGGLMQVGRESWACDRGFVHVCGAREGEGAWGSVWGRVGDGSCQLPWNGLVPFHTITTIHTWPHLHTRQARVLTVRLCPPLCHETLPQALDLLLPSAAACAAVGHVPGSGPGAPAPPGAMQRDTRSPSPGLGGPASPGTPSRPPLKPSRGFGPTIQAVLDYLVSRWCVCGVPGWSLQLAGGCWRGPAAWGEGRREGGGGLGSSSKQRSFVWA